jgi:hypothetical protein
MTTAATVGPRVTWQSSAHLTRLPVPHQCMSCVRACRGALKYHISAMLSVRAGKEAVACIIAVAPSPQWQPEACLRRLDVLPGHQTHPAPYHLLLSVITTCHVFHAPMVTSAMAQPSLWQCLPQPCALTPTDCTGTTWRCGSATPAPVTMSLPQHVAPAVALYRGTPSQPPQAHQTCCTTLLPSARQRCFHYIGPQRLLEPCLLQLWRLASRCTCTTQPRRDRPHINCCIVWLTACHVSHAPRSYQHHHNMPATL